MQTKTAWGRTGARLVAIVLASLCSSVAEAQQRRPPPRERQRETEAQERKRETEAQERQREIEAQERKRQSEAQARLPQVEAEGPKSDVQPPEVDAVKVRWDREIKEYIDSAPERAKLKGWESQIYKFEREFRDRTPTEKELQAWYREHIGVEPVQVSSFRGALREVSDVVRLRFEGYTEVQWNRERERVDIVLSNGDVVPMKDREIDIIARRPADAAESPGRRMYIETKNANLDGRFKQEEVRLLESLAPVENLYRYVQRTEPSREFSELVRDIWLSKTKQRSYEWRVNSGPGYISRYLIHHRINIKIEMYH